MPDHRVVMTEPKHDILNADIDFWVYADGKQLGHLHVSKGGVDWYSTRSSKTKYSATWEFLDNLMRENGTKKLAPRPKRKRR